MLPMLPMSLDCPFLIAPSVSFNALYVIAYLARHLVQFEENLLIFHGKIRNNLSFVSCENIIDQLQGKHSSLA
jgi:hypothetical protein